MTIDTSRAAAEPASAGDPGGQSRARTELRCFLELFVLCGFVVAQPLFDVAGRSPDFFLFRRAGAADILVLVALTVLGPPLLLWAGEALVGLVSGRLRRVAHLVVVAGLLLLLTIELAKNLTSVRGWPLLLLGVAGGVAATVVYARSAAARLWLRYLSPAPLVFALLFVTVSPVGKLVVGGGDNGPARAVVPASARVPIVMVFFDEFPMTSLLDSKGQIDRRVYLNLAKLADQSTWYRNATGIGPFTPYAVPAMLTGQYPTRVGVAPSYTEYPDNLFTWLSGSYDVRAFETVTQLCPPRICAAAAGAGGHTGWRALTRDLAGVWAKIVSPRRMDEDPTAQFVEAAGDPAAGADQKKRGPTFRFNQLKANQPSRFNDFLDQLRPSDQPALHFLHILLPHQHWKYLPSGAQYSYPSINFGYDRKVGWTTQPAGPSGPSRRVPPTSACGCRCSSRPPTSGRARSTTATGSTWTWSPPSPTSSRSRCPGTSTACRAWGRSDPGRRSASTPSPASQPRSTARATWPWPSAGSPTGSPGPRTAWPGCSRWGRTPTWSAASLRGSGWPVAAGCGPSSTIPRTSRT